MKKLIMLAMVIGLLLSPFTTFADVLYTENFEDGVANGVGGGYLVTENGNTFYESWTGSGSNVPMYTTQTFQGNISLEYSTRNNGRYDIGVYLINPNWQIQWFSSLGGYAPGSYIGFAVTNPTGYDFGEWVVPFPLDYQWYDVRVTLVGGVTKFYMDGVLMYEHSVVEYIPTVYSDEFQFVWLTWGKRDIDYIEVNSVPEPATMLLLGSGLIGLAGYGRRKFSKK